MRERFLILLVSLLVAAAAAGCGGKDQDPGENIENTDTPEKKEDTKSNLVDMQTTVQSGTPAAEDTNVIGTRTATAAKVVIINRTGDDISAIYIRENTDDDEEWGEELIQGAFTLRNGDQASYYYEKKGSSKLYDIRITYSDPDRNECFFRKLPLNSIKQISLCMDGEGEDSIPYARYVSGSGGSEYSTLREVKERLGIYDDSDDGEDPETEITVTPAPTGAPSAAPSPSPVPTEDPGEDPGSGSGEDPNGAVSQAEEYVGQPLDELVAALGPFSGNSYENEPETGETGYYYYNIDGTTFTVSTSVDEDGNEIVSGVW